MTTYHFEPRPPVPPRGFVDTYGSFRRTAFGWRIELIGRTLDPASAPYIMGADDLNPEEIVERKAMITGWMYLCSMLQGAGYDLRRMLAAFLTDRGKS